MSTKSFLQWSLVCLILLFLIGLTGCSNYGFRFGNVPQDSEYEVLIILDE